MNREPTERAPHFLGNPPVPSAPANSVASGFHGETPPARRALFALLVLFVSGCGTDTVEVRGEKRSPDGKFVATSFYCEGGGAAGYCYNNASLRRAGDELNQRDGLLGKHKTWMSFSDIEISWIDDRNLEISYAQDARPAYREHNSVRVESKHGIKIHYIVTE